jgi:membrane protein implicated in regulation of membrane protease activity
MKGNYYTVSIVSALVFTMGLWISGQWPWHVSTWVFTGCLVAAYLLLRASGREYAKNMDKLDQHLQNLKKGEATPPLRELTA